MIYCEPAWFNLTPQCNLCFHLHILYKYPSHFMPYSALNDIPASVRERAARIRLACFDVDGVLTDGKLWYSDSGSEMKAFHVHDGLGLQLLRDHGLEVVLITARESQLVVSRARELGIEHVYQNQKNKLDTFNLLLESFEFHADQVAYTGDDLPDLPVLCRAGLATAVANAHSWVKQHSHWITRHSGGNGAVREVCDLILAAQGKSEALLTKVCG